MKYIKLLLLLVLVSCNSTKQIKGYFENLEKTKKLNNTEYTVKVKGSNVESSFNKKGDFKLDYPKNGGSIIVSNDDNYVIIKENIPEDTQGVIVLVDDVREMITFVKKGEDFEKQYINAVFSFNLLLSKIDQFSIYPGCENVGVEEYKKCFRKKVTRHAQRYFDVELANELGMTAGRKTIFILFEIDEKGKIDVISVKAPHPLLKKVGERIVKKMPVMKPGMNRGKPVSIRYTLPISFHVE